MSEKKKTLCIGCGETFENYGELYEHARTCDSYIPFEEIRRKLERMDRENKLLRGGETGAIR